MATLKVRLEALEDLLMEKFGETEDSLQERVMLRVEKMQGFKEVSTPVQTGSFVRIKVKEEVVGQESPTNPMTTQYICIGHKQVNEAIDDLILGANVGETRDIILDDPANAQLKRRITVFVGKIFEGEEVKNNETSVQPQAAATS